MKYGAFSKWVTVGMAMTLAAACGGKDSATDDVGADPTTSGSSPTSGGPSGNKVGSASSLADLKLSGALAVQLPEAFNATGASSSLALVAGKKSQEACMMGEVITHETRALSEVGGFFCHMEVEKDRLKFGKKYKIMTPMGEFARLMVDDSKASEGKLTIGFCGTNRESDGSSSRNHQLITIDSLSENGPTGSLVTDGSGTRQSQAYTYGQSVAFDMSAAGVAKIVGKRMYSQVGDTFVRAVSLELLKAGTSTLKVANRGTSSFGSFYDRGIALVSADKGSAVFQSKGVDQSNNSFEFARRAHFSRNGDALGSGDVGADLQPAVSAMPDYLAADFKPDGLTGWVGQDCPDFDEEVNLDPDSAVHKACDSGPDKEFECWDQSKFDSSNEQITIQ